ncbi:flagellar basal-body rod protein FlgG [Athalassotoga saccharophila]|uniref:flagellar basal-body rod protein FlgG n=1 Tax=Athalassotoga saccharophila TaxID=1441386 RepID=UPI00137A3955|nr:flagellar basal-body rod protein FlgG [Athalassotoga saccharophila]BBJ27185.1 flagellar basal-body rod protein FlgG [Athalassotoga saccharophila]
MLNSLSTAATGMNAQQFMIDTISNNLANANTTAFKESRAEFADLAYQNLYIAGTPTSQNTQSPTGLYVGHGTRLVATNRLFTLGSLSSTGNPLDLAIDGDGFFQVQLQNGQIGYTRDGSFNLDGQGRLVTSDGYVVVPNIVIPQNAESINIAPNGTVTVTQPGGTQTQVGQITLVRFLNPAGLESIGDNLYVATPASGQPIQGIANQDGFGALRQGYLETSNVNVIQQMVDMINAERAYEFDSKVIQTSDQMLQDVATLKQ